MTYAVSFGLPQSGGSIIVRSDEGPVRVADVRKRAFGVTSAAFDARPGTAQTEEQDMRSLLREVIAIRKAGAKK